MTTLDREVEKALVTLLALYHMSTVNTSSFALRALMFHAMYTSVVAGLRVNRVVWLLTEFGKSFTARSVTMQFSVGMLTPVPVAFHCFEKRRVVDAAVLFRDERIFQ